MTLEHISRVNVKSVDSIAEIFSAAEVLAAVLESFDEDIL